MLRAGEESSSSLSTSVAGLVSENSKLLDVGIGVGIGIGVEVAGGRA